MSNYTPTRMCIGCRTRKGKHALLRFVYDEALLWDAKQKHPGRGAYLCGDTACIKKIIKKNMLGHIFSVPLSEADKQLLEDMLHE